MFNTSELADARSEAGLVMDHTYTRTPRVTGADDAYGDRAFTAGTALLKQPCRYSERTTVAVGPNGVVNVNVPTLMVPTTDTLNEGDQVSQIATSDGTLLVGGPVEVEDVTPVFPDAGGPMYRRARLRQIQEI